jgi:single-strand DNA-binding protein
MNNVILMGRLTADPELRQTQSGTSSCRFTIAVNRKFKNKETNEYDADFITCVAWRQTAEFVSRYFSKGSMICVSGSLRSGSYTDKNHSDVTHYTTDVYVDGVEFTGEKKQQGAGSTQNQQPQQQQRPHFDSVNDAAGNQYAQQLQQAAEQTAMSYGNLSEFEEILGDGSDLPF